MDLPLSDFETNGCAFFTGAISDETCDEFLTTLGSYEIGAGTRGHDLPERLIDLINSSEELKKLAGQISDSPTQCVRIIIFDKSEAANWGVPWHQDKTIAVKEKIDIAGYGPWTRKGDIPHVEAPLEILENMVTLRVHLDDCGLENGPLEVAIGGHKSGKQKQDTLVKAAPNSVVSITASKGDVFAMSPLLPHRSKPAINLERRRVLHIEYASGNLPAPLSWHADL